jgi:AcrR family transcriptional regulator
MGKKKSSEETIKKILEVSKRLFFEYGYENTSLQNIINELDGLSKGAIYYHFDSKESILNAISEKMLYESSPFIIVEEYKKLNGLEKIRKAFMLSLDNSEQQYLNKMLIKNTNSPKMICEIIDTNKRVLTPQFLKLVNEGIEDGSIKTDFPKEMSEITLMLINIWLLSFMGSGNYKELVMKIDFISSMTKNMGIDFIDSELRDKLIRVLSSLNNLHEE